MTQLTVDDCDFIITSLDYTVRRFEEYGVSTPYHPKGYPSYEFQQQQISEAKAVRQKVRDLRKALKAAK